jgi:hypothetical protein
LGCESVGARDDDDVAAGLLAGVHGGADPGCEFGEGGELFVFQVAATFGGQLVFEMEGGDAGEDVRLDCAGDVYGS